MASSAPRYKYDVFISYSHANRDWVQTWLLPQIEAAGLRACIDDRDFAIGAPSIVNLEAAVIQSRHTLIVLTPAWVKSQWTAFEALLTQTTDPAGRQQRVLPLLLEPCQPPLRIAALSYLDFTDPQEHTAQLRRLIDTLQGRVRPADLGQPLQHLLPDELLTLDERNRRTMLRKVRRIWITDVLEQSLYKQVLLTLDLSTRPDAVSRPIDLVFQPPNRAEQLLPSDKHIIEVYDELQGALLILGAPGAGKTTLLLQLARDLIDRTERDPCHPIPIVFPLASWAEQRQSLSVWMVDELNKRYDIPRKLAQPWVDADQILPLLDGLDEVAQEHRGACVEAINTYRQDHGLLSLVVCTRIADYDALTIKLRLEGAIVAQPLTQEQAKDYLRRIGLYAALSSTSSLWDLLDTPLMLNIATLAYMDQPEAALQTRGTLEQRRDQLFTTYVKRMFQRNRAQLLFPKQQTVQWLSWLAWQMQQHNQIIFYIEHMQPAWLLRRQQWLPTVGVGLLVGVVGAGSLGLVGWVVGAGSLGLLGGGIGGGSLGLVCGCSLGAIFSQKGGDSKEIKIVELVHWSWSNLRVAFWSVVLHGVSSGLSIGLLYGLGLGPFTELITWMNSDPFTWLRRNEILDVAVILLTTLATGLGDGLRGGLIVGLLVGLLVAVGSGVFQGLSSAEIPTKAVPNQGIWRSAKNALIFGLLYSLIGCLVVGLGIGVLASLSLGLAYGWVWGLNLGLIGGVFGGMFAVLHYGGRTCLQHLVLRRLLVRNGSAPLNYINFLDFATSRILLRKVGGGYIFIHRLLLDYFAKQYTGPETAEVNTPSKGT